MEQIDKKRIIQKIISALSDDLAVFTTAAKAAHEAATHAECIPDNKYDTTALEASYIAQGQANRAHEIRVAVESFRVLPLQNFDHTTPIRLTALVTLEDSHGNYLRLFLGPMAGGLKITCDNNEIVVITPASPLGRSLLGLHSGDEVVVGDTSNSQTYIIESIS